jgi:hypothetical protein
MQRIILAGTLLLALCSPASAGPIYKWVDAQGTTHYGTQPPKGQQATSVNPGIAPSRAVAPAPVTAESDAVTDAQDGLDPEQEAINAQVKADVAAQAAQRAENCKTYRTNLAQLENNPRVRIEDAGQIRRLGEEERQAKIAETKQLISDNCL